MLKQRIFIENNAPLPKSPNATVSEDRFYTCHGCGLELTNLHNNYVDLNIIITMIKWFLIMGSQEVSIFSTLLPSIFSTLLPSLWVWVIAVGCTPVWSFLSAIDSDTINRMTLMRGSVGEACHVPTPSIDICFFSFLLANFANFRRFFPDIRTLAWGLDLVVITQAHVASPCMAMHANTLALLEDFWSSIC